MARQRIAQGVAIDFVTPDEIVKLIPRPPQVTRMRAAAALQLDATGSGIVDVYKVPIGYEFAVRRVTLDLFSATDPSTGSVALNAAGKFVAYLRSGVRIEYGQPAYGSTIQIPGVQTWGDQQGAYLRNGEVFQLQAKGLTASVQLSVSVEGLLTRPGTDANA